MKLKTLVVASMSVLGLSLSYPVLADSTPKHKHHHKHVVVKKVCHEECRVPCAQPAPAPCVRPTCTVPCVDRYAPVMDFMTQNVGRSVHASPDWFQRIGVTGGINFDSNWLNRNMGYMGENYKRFSLNDAYINVTALVNCWTKAFVSLSYNDTSVGTTFFSESTPVAPNAIFVNNGAQISQHLGGSYSNAYDTDADLDLEQAYITFGNFDCSPFFVQLGKQFQDFGRYQIHPIERTMAQVLSESNHTSAKAGFVTPMGLTGSVYGFENPLRKVNQGSTDIIWGAALGFEQPCDQLGYDFGVGYMSNMVGVNDVAAAVTNFENLAVTTVPSGAIANPAGTYTGTVGAWNVYGDVNSGPFTIGARYTTAAHNFSPFTLSTFGGTWIAVPSTFGGTSIIPTANVNAAGARPWAFDVTAGYGFCLCSKSQNVYVGYQKSGDAENLLLPQQRWIAGYEIDAWQNVSLAAQYGYDKDYSIGHGGTGQNSSTLGLRAAVRFG